MTPEVSAHLAELDARYEAHLAALHERAREAKDAVETGVHSLEDALPPATIEHAPRAPFEPPPLRSGLDVEEPPPYVAPPPNPYAEHALIPDTPLGTSEPLNAPALDDFAAVDDDGIPLWQD